MRHEVRDILDLRRSAGDAGAVLATVVSVEGSSYARPGSRLLVTADGRRAGLVSGGCLERDLARRAMVLTEGGPALVAYDTRADRLHPAGPFGSGCEGLVHLLLERVGGTGSGTGNGAGERGTDGASATLDLLGRVADADDPAALATVWRSADPAVPVGTRLAAGPRDVGTGGVGHGGVGHGGVGPGDHALAGPLRDLAADRRPAAPVESRALDLGGGRVDVLLERLDPPRPLVIFGGGDDARPLVALAAAAGWAVTLVDKRPTLADPARFPGARRVACAPPETAGSRVRLTPRSAVVLMTHDLADDAALLPGLLASDAFYVGVLGPPRRLARLMADLHAAGRLPDPSALGKLHAPVGLDLGADGPAEIAVAVIAEIVAASRDRPTRAARDANAGGNRAR